MARTKIRHLLSLSRFDRYNPLFTTFAGVWSTLLAGGSRIAEHQSTTSPSSVFTQSALCFMAAYLFCGAGMVWNDWVDRDIDAHVARTKERPLASKKVTTTEAMAWMMLQACGSWGVLEFMLDRKDVMKHFAPVAAASIAYPFAKRHLARTLGIYPQYILAFTIAWPAVIGRAAIYGKDEPFTDSLRYCLPLCAMVYFWTIYLNTAYSYQDVVDDRKLGVNSFYNIAGRHIHLLLIALVAPVLVCLPMCLMELRSIWMWVSWMGVWTVSLGWQLFQFDPKQPSSGGSLHKNNFLMGTWTILACIIQVLITGSV